MNKCSGTLSMERPGPSCLARARSQLKAVSLITGGFCSKGPPGFRAQCGSAKTTRKQWSPSFPHQCARGRGLRSSDPRVSQQSHLPIFPKDQVLAWPAFPGKPALYFPVLSAHVNTFLIYFTKS